MVDPIIQVRGWGDTRKIPRSAEPVNAPLAREGSLYRSGRAEGDRKPLRFQDHRHGLAIRKRGFRHDDLGAQRSCPLNRGIEVVHPDEQLDEWRYAGGRRPDATVNSALPSLHLAIPQRVVASGFPAKKLFEEPGRRLRIGGDDLPADDRIVHEFTVHCSEVFITSRRRWISMCSARLTLSTSTPVFTAIHRQSGRNPGFVTSWMILRASSSMSATLSSCGV